LAETGSRVRSRGPWTAMALGIDLPIKNRPCLRESRKRFETGWASKKEARVFFSKVDDFPVPINQLAQNYRKIFL
jgi:hypothetical protein